MTVKKPLQCWQRLRRVERQLDEAIKVRNLLIMIGKISLEDFERAESIVHDLAPSEPEAK
jgi:hypothetical protein